MFHFKSDVINLRDGSFRKRVKTDFVTRCLNYDYEGRDKQAIETVTAALWKIKYMYTIHYTA